MEESFDDGVYNENLSWRKEEIRRVVNLGGKKKGRRENKIGEGWRRMKVGRRKEVGRGKEKWRRVMESGGGGKIEKERRNGKGEFRNGI